MQCGNIRVNICDDPSKYIAWDEIHLTEAAYKLMVQGFIKGSNTLPPFSWLC